MNEIILQIFLIVGFIVGWYTSYIELKNSKYRIPYKNMIKYWTEL